MKLASRFLTQPDDEPQVRFTLDGEEAIARPGDTVAAALLAHSGTASRWTAKGTPRTAFCMMGVCFDCLAEIDGRPNTQTCMVQVHEGMIVRRQNGLRGLSNGDRNV